MSFATRTSAAALEALNGSPRYVAGLSISSTVATQAVDQGGMYVVQSDQDVYVHAATASNGTIKKADGTTATLTTALGFKVVADEKFFITLRGDESYIAAITSSATGTLKIFKMEAM